MLAATQCRLLSRIVKIKVYTCCSLWGWGLVCDHKGKNEMRVF